MNFFKKIKAFIKRKFPATFNAAEYETERVLKRIEQNEKVIVRLSTQVCEIDGQIKNLSEMLENCLNALNSVEGLRDELCAFKAETRQSFECFQQVSAECVSNVHTIIERISDVRSVSDTVRNTLREISEMQDKHNASIMTGLSSLQDDYAQMQSEEKKRIDELSRSIGNLNEIVMRSDLNAIVSCRSDDDYDRMLIPLNRYFNNRGVAVSMHLTSVADKPNPIVYETADIIRTSALSLVADEIRSKQLDGAVAELGVAQGKFARVINALFPEKTLHLFDTFDDFPEEDVAVDNERNFSSARRGSYTDIDIEALLVNMPHPEQCALHKGYFPQTAKGIDEVFCFVNIDCDLYKPISDGLEFFYPRLIKGGCIFVHDYRSKYFTGVKAAMKEFAEKYEISYCVLPDNTGTAVIMK